MKITRIKVPKFKVGRYSLNEYELRNLMLQVAKKEVPANIVVKEVGTGLKATILEDGSLSTPLESLGINSRYTLDILKLKRQSL